jgi:hypothetical protein
MNKKKSISAGKTKSEKGQQVFGDNADDVLAKKIVAHSRKSSGGKKDTPPPEAHPKKTEAPKSAFTYRTPEEKHRSKTAGYGIAALVGLLVLGIFTFLWSKFKKD